MVDQRFAHRTRGVEGKDGNPGREAFGRLTDASSDEIEQRFTGET